MSWAATSPRNVSLKADNCDTASRRRTRKMSGIATEDDDMSKDAAAMSAPSYEPAFGRNNFSPAAVGRTMRPCHRQRP
jgi:hypothetical protein